MSLRNQVFIRFIAASGVNSMNIVRQFHFLEFYDLNSQMRF